MKRTPLKRKTPLKAKQGFRKTITLDTTRLTIDQYRQIKRNSTLRVKGNDPSSILKEEIQGLLRAIVILRDGGCFLRHYRDKINSQYIECGTHRKDGDLILQAEHLHTRSSARAFSDSRMLVCCCQRHHLYFKTQHSSQYNRFARDFIGDSRCKLWEDIEDTRFTAYKVDLKLEKLALEKELKSLLKKPNQDIQNFTDNVREQIYKDYKYLL